MNYEQQRTFLIVQHYRGYGCFVRAATDIKTTFDFNDVKKQHE